MADGDFTIPDTAAQPTTDLNTLFGVNQNVGGTPVTVRGARPAGTTYAPSGIAPIIPSAESTLTDTLQGFYGMDPAALTNLQQQLWAGGYYASSYYGKTPKPPQFGTPDDDSFSAFKSAAVQAARSGQPLDQLIDTAVKANSVNGGPGGAAASQRAPLVTQLPNPDDLRAVITDSARRILGHRVSEDVIQGIIAGYQQQAQVEQQDTYNAQPGGGVVTQAATPANYVAAQLQAGNPTDAAAHRGLGIGNLIMNAFMSSAGNPPLGGTGG